MDPIPAGQQGRVRREDNDIETSTRTNTATRTSTRTSTATRTSTGNDIHDPTARRPSPVGEAADPHCLRPGEARSLLAGAPWRRLVVLGDLAVERAAEPVEGYGPGPWYDRVATALDEAAQDVAYLNLLGRREPRVAQVRSGQLPAALAFRGDLALVCCGTAYTPDETFGRYGLTAELVRIVTPLRDAGHDVVLLGSHPLAAWPGLPDGRRERVAEQQNRVSEQARAVALRHGTLYVEPPPRRPGTEAAAVWSRDRPRPNSRGHAALAAAVVRALGTRPGAAAGREPVRPP
ncbi:SGNH/GDSL hydrolase family protein [Streptomyces sp. JV176]|uniref:GDSL-type esterase/lipase family protein n=1 Tax=Streptomyces sp. JV176 TaxID=858630 RepID=UPI002E791964|nr:GDSL-type esterase/lipase family protein [Streptomyces sp. JV176]MEE1802538.1 SGNH/GDSL hydrolase family protein [Streptomyces sp. JV176]